MQAVDYGTYNPNYISPRTHAKLESLVKTIIANPGAMMKFGQFDELTAKIDPKVVIAHLPKGVGEEQLFGMAMLSHDTECATPIYTRELTERALRFEWPSLDWFIRQVWDPDEESHFLPYRLFGMGMGASEAHMDERVKRARASSFTHRGVDTPAGVVMFGTEQEYLTGNWHRIMAKLIRPACPEAASAITWVAQREVLHKQWYREMAAILLEEEPRRVQEMAHAIIRFEMPGNQICPELEHQVSGWLTNMGADIDQIVAGMVREIYKISSSTGMAGKMALEIGEAKGMKMGWIKVAHVHHAINRLGQPGSGIVGEAVMDFILTLVGESLLEKFHLSKLWTPEKNSDPAYRFYTGPVELVRSLLRNWVASKIKVDLGTSIG